VRLGVLAEAVAAAGSGADIEVVALVEDLVGIGLPEGS
jgi:hypothetical protein